jgi:hypothetical protein
MCLNSFWVSLDFEWIWIFYHGEIGQPPNEQGLVATNNKFVHKYLMKQGYFKVKYKITNPFNFLIN